MAEVFDFGLQEHKIKMDGGFSNNGLFAVVGDTARRLEVQLLNSNNAIQDTTGINLRLNAEVAGKLTFVDAVVKDATKGIYTVNLSNGMFLEPGNWGFQWQITKGTNKISSFPFAVKIGENISEGGSQATNFYLNVEELRLKTVELENRYQALINSTTGKDVISAPEIIAARSGEVDLNARLTKNEQETTAQFQQNEGDIRKIQNNPTNYAGALVSIIDDDAMPDFRTVWQPILNDNPDIKISIAVIKDYSLDGRALSVEELLALQDDGHDLLCHTTHHEASYLTTPERAEEDYPQAIKWMKETGMKGYEYLVYPGGLAPDFISIKDIARKHFKYAISTEAAGDYAIAPVDNWCIGRINGDVKTLEELKASVDYAKENNIWLILMTHSHILLEEGAQKMRDFIAYVKSQDIPIITFSEAVKLKGNAIAVGEYTKNGVFVSVEGEMFGSGYLYKKGLLLFNQHIKHYRKGTTTEEKVTYLQDVFKNTGGVMRTHRQLDDAYSYQEYSVTGLNEEYIRWWNVLSGDWNLFELINDTAKFLKGTDNLMDKSIIFYKKNTVTYVQITYLQDTFLGLGGNMVVIRGDNDSYSYLEFTPFSVGDSSERYVRRVINVSDWGPFKKL